MNEARPVPSWPKHACTVRRQVAAHRHQLHVSKTKKDVDPTNLVDGTLSSQSLTLAAAGEHLVESKVAVIQNNMPFVPWPSAEPCQACLGTYNINTAHRKAKSCMIANASVAPGHNCCFALSSNAHAA